MASEAYWDMWQSHLPIEGHTVIWSQAVDIETQTNYCMNLCQAI